MKTISQRELRNDNAQIMRAVEQGEHYVVTRHGVPVATLGPVTGADSLRLARPARGRLDPAALRRVTSTTSTADVLDDLRSDG